MKSIIKPYSNKGFVDSAGSFATLIFCQLKKRRKGERERYQLVRTSKLEMKLWWVKK